MIGARRRMKVLIVSDIHANRVALQAVLAAEPDHENVLCLGHLVDYGPHSVECIAWAAATCQEGGWYLQGNHDWSVAPTRIRAAPNPMSILPWSLDPLLEACWAKVP